jgi:hypothetical protein
VVLGGGYVRAQRAAVVSEVGLQRASFGAGRAALAACGGVVRSKPLRAGAWREAMLASQRLRTVDLVSEPRAALHKRSSADESPGDRHPPSQCRTALSIPALVRRGSARTASPASWRRACCGRRQERRENRAASPGLR